MSNKPIIIPSFEGRAEDAMDVEVFVPESPLFDLGSVEENLPIHVNIPTEPIYSCDRCQSVFKSKALLRDHIIRKYIITNPDDYQYTCEECGKKFPTGYSLKAHIRNKKARNTKVTCDICNDKVSKKDWGSHFAKHNNDEKFNCIICQKVVQLIKNYLKNKSNLISNFRNSPTPHS